jgi:hypothetical protein
MFILHTYVITQKTLIQTSDVEIQSLVNHSALFGVLRIKRVILAVLVYKIDEDGTAEKLEILNLVPKIIKLKCYL